MKHVPSGGGPSSEEKFTVVLETASLNEVEKTIEHALARDIVPDDERNELRVRLYGLVK